MTPGSLLRVRLSYAPLAACLLQLACGSSDSQRDHLNQNGEETGGAVNNSSAGSKVSSVGSGGAGYAGVGGATASQSGHGGSGSVGQNGNAGSTPGSAVQAGAAGKAPLARIGDDVFDDTQVKSYYLTFSDEEYAKLTDLSTLLLDPYTVNEDRYVEAALRVGDTELPSIGVRYKGNYSIWGCVDYVTKQRVVRVEPFFGNIDVCQRFSLKLDLNRYDSKARLDGLKKLNLHAMAADPSKLRERLGYSLFRDAEIVAPRAVHARVYINGEYQGLFAAVENVDGRFTANRFGDAGDGNLYRDLWPSEGLTRADAEAALKTNQDPGVVDVSDFLAFNDAVHASSEADFATRMAPYLDFDYLARYIVVDRAINSTDGIMAFYFGNGWGPANQNYFWYNIGRGRFTLIPWDHDKSLWYPEPNFWSDNAPHDNGPVPNWNVVTKDCAGEICGFDAVTVRNGEIRRGYYGVKEIDCDPFLKQLRAQVYDRQKAMADVFLAGPFSEANVRAKVEAWRSQIADGIKEDALVDSVQWQSSVDALLSDVPKFQNNLSLMMNGLITE